MKNLQNNKILKSSGLVLVNSTNYNQWQYEQFKPYIGDKVLEIGSGLGNLTQFLLQGAKYLMSTDIKPDAVDYCKNRFNNINNNVELNIKCMDIIQDDLVGYPDFNTIVFSNVLEHIQDDLSAMKKCHDLLNLNSGILLLLVPAHQFLYGTLDRESGHFKRYSKKDIIYLADKANFKLLDLYSFNIIGAIGWYINYCLLQRRGTNEDESSMQTSFFDKYLVNPSKYLESKIKPPFGISYIAILKAEK
jgi:2-polyprenyl-3-methyl-5-hydroxy-6-metoxy-1,4-benzoquinol methylase